MPLLSWYQHCSSCKHSLLLTNDTGIQILEILLTLKFENPHLITNFMQAYSLTLKAPDWWSPGQIPSCKGSWKNESSLHLGKEGLLMWKLCKYRNIFQMMLGGQKHEEKTTTLFICLYIHITILHLSIHKLFYLLGIGTLHYSSIHFQHLSQSSRVDS